MAHRRRALAGVRGLMRVDGIVTAPGDKSVTHRAMMLAARAGGVSELRRPLAAADTRGTARVLRQLGARVGLVGRGDVVRVTGARWQRPAKSLHCGNSGTTARLMLGFLAGDGIAARVTGDRSLRRRPMGRVTDPLEAMGATFAANGYLPIRVQGAVQRGVTWVSPVASAQVKTAILFAGLAGGVGVTVTEPWRSRDHTERLFRAIGHPLVVDDTTVRFMPEGPIPIVPFAIDIPGDTSSAAFPVGVALLARGGSLVVAGTGVNPTRTGFLDVLDRMGAHIARHDTREVGAEPVADLEVRPSTLRGVEVAADEIPRLVDEVPLLAVLASRAAGESVFRAVGELRVKESNRLELMAANLRAVGADAEVSGDDLHVRGGDYRPAGRVETAGDHRLAMAFAVLGTVEGATIVLSETRSPDVSYPGFFTMLGEIEA